MLILQRKKEQSLVINDNITLSIVDVGSDWVKLSIDAPKDVKILRSELVEAANANLEASTVSKDSISTLQQSWKKMSKNNPAS